MIKRPNFALTATLLFTTLFIAACGAEEISKRTPRSFNKVELPANPSPRRDAPYNAVEAVTNEQSKIESSSSSHLRQVFPSCTEIQPEDNSPEDYWVNLPELTEYRSGKVCTKRNAFKGCVQWDHKVTIVCTFERRVEFATENVD